MSLASEVLLQRTRAHQVAGVYEAFRERYPSPRALAGETVHGLLSLTGTLGLHWRAPLMIRMAEVVADRGEVPGSLEELANLPGVGPYAASAYLSLHRGVRASIVDANVVRWIGRVFGVPVDAETRRKKWLLDLADRLTPERSFRDYNYAVLDLSMNVCAARPRCEACPLAKKLCKFAGGSSYDERSSVENLR